MGKIWKIWLALFPGLPTLQFLIACIMQKQRGGLVHFIMWLWCHVMFIARPFRIVPSDQNLDGHVVASQQIISRSVLCQTPACMSIAKPSDITASDKTFQAFPYVFRWSNSVGPETRLGETLEIFGPALPAYKRVWFYVCPLTVKVHLTIPGVVDPSVWRDAKCLHQRQ